MPSGALRFTMASRMTAPVTPQNAETPSQEVLVGAPRVQVLLTVVEGADLAAALAVVGRQIYQPEPEVVIVGAEGEAPEGYQSIATLEQAIREADQRTDYLWILHSDARPRPDALGALVSEMERNQASLGGSKLLVAGSRDQLESVGSATDVFGEPYSGLEEGEIDLQQYDVVREVAFVRSASMLVRRDLAQGLRGLDVLLPPIAAGLDFSQRSRLAGGRVISVPSSEVYHQGRCNEGLGGWREQAGRLRAMLTAYRPLTLLWVVPYDFLVSVIDSLANLLLLRWRPSARHLLSWLWNLYHLPSTVRLRLRNRRVRVAGDEELFRFQARGSVRLREIGSEISARVLGLFDEDQALTRGTRRVWAAPGIWGAVVGGLIAVFAARSLILLGVPDVGFTFPFEAPMVAVDRWVAGWNDSGLGSSAPVHPSTLLTAALSAVTWGSVGAARTLSTIALVMVGIVGIGRLGGRLGLRGPGRYLSGLVLVGGPGTAVLTGVGSWTGMAAAALLPWVVRAVLVADEDHRPKTVGDYGWAVLLSLPLAALSPVLMVVPVMVALVMPPSSLRRRRVGIGLVGLVSLVAAVPFVLGDPGWLLEGERRVMVVPTEVWAVLIGVAVTPIVFVGGRWRTVGTVGAVLSLAAMVALRFPIGGPGIEEALLVVASFGAALLIAAGLDVISMEPGRVLAVLTAGVVLAMSIGPLANGRYGLPSGEVNDRLGFSTALAGDADPGRILIASTERPDIPGEARPGPGFWYRVVDGSGMTSDEAWLPPPLQGDNRLESVLARIATGDELRPGELLAPFAIDWVVLDGPAFRLDDSLVGQLDLMPTPLVPGSRVFENLARSPLAHRDGDPWVRLGAGYTGEPGGTVRLAVNHVEGWRPAGSPDDWAVSVDGSEGVARYRGSSPQVWLSLATVAVLLASLALVGVGRRKR